MSPNEKFNGEKSDELPDHSINFQFLISLRLPNAISQEFLRILKNPILKKQDKIVKRIKKPLKLFVKR